MIRIVEFFRWLFRIKAFCNCCGRNTWQKLGAQQACRICKGNPFRRCPKCDGAMRYYDGFHCECGHFE